MRPIIGIDFGTSNSVICELRGGRPTVLPNDLGDSTTPSIVTVTEEGTLEFGKIAREQFQPGRSVRSIKRLLGIEKTVELGGQDWRVESIAASMFKKLKLDAESRLKTSILEAVITVPANSKGLQRTATKICAKMAGIQALTLINEPTAAAMAYGLDLQTPQTLLVYDFGGGTFDVTVLKVHHGLFEELSSKGIRLLGGDDIDQALYDAVLTGCGLDAAELAEPSNVYWAQRLLLACEQAKIALSDRPSTPLRIPGFMGRQHLEHAISREDFEAIAMPFVRRTADPIDDALRSAGVLPKDLDHILLVGGTSKMPMVRAFVEAHLGRLVMEAAGVDPLTCVAEGAAIAAGILMQAPELAERDYLVRLEHSLCADPFDPAKGHTFLDPIIPKGSSIPTVATHRYWPMVDYAPMIHVGIYEGDVYDEPDHPDNARLLSINVPLVPPRRVEDAGLEVSLRYGEDGILGVEVRDMHVDRVVSQETVTYAQAMLEEEEQVAEAEALAALFTTPEASAERHLLAEARELIEEVEEEAADEIRTLVMLTDDLAQRLDHGDGAEALTQSADRLREELLSLSYLKD